MRLTRFLAIAILAVGLAACQTLGTAVKIITYNATNPVTVTMVQDLRLGYDALEPFAIAYIEQPLCSPIHKTFCSDAAVSAKLKSIGPKARLALQRLETFVRVNGTLNAGVLYREAVDAFNAFSTLTPTGG